MALLGGTLDAGSIGLGCMSVSGQYSNGVPLEEEAATAFFKGVYDAGYRHFDTAEVYKSGEFNGPITPDTVFNETQLGRFLETVPRSSFTVATKYMPVLPPRSNKCDYETVRDALLASLQRLGLEYVDLYYSHMVLTLEAGVEFATSVKKLVAEGLVKNLGLSEINESWLRTCHAVHPVCCIQQEWSLLTRIVEESLVPTCKELGVGIVAYSPLARNLLTLPKTRPDDKRRAGIPRFTEENFEKNRKMFSKLEELAKQKSLSPAQLSLAWLYQKASDLGVVMLPIPGTAKLPHALDNLKSVGLCLAPEEMVLLEEVGAQCAGARENEQYISMRVEGQVSRLELAAEAQKNPKKAAEAVILHAEGCSHWPIANQKWLQGGLERGSEGIDEVLSGLVEHHANDDGTDFTRVFPGASDEFKTQVLEALKTSDFVPRVSAKFQSPKRDSMFCAACGERGCVLS